MVQPLIEASDVIVLGIVLLARILFKLAVCAEDATIKAPVIRPRMTPSRRRIDVIRLFDGKTLGDSYTWLKDTKREDPRKVFMRCRRHDSHQRRRLWRASSRTSDIAIITSCSNSSLASAPGTDAKKWPGFGMS